MDMTPRIKNMTAGCTIASTFACGLLELAVSRGASRQALAERAGIDPAELQDPDTRLPFAKYVALTHAAPAYRAEYERIFQVPVVFGSDKNALLLSGDAWMAERPPASSRLVLDVLSAHADAQLESLDVVKTTRGGVESLLVPILHTGAVSMDGVAAKLGISRQT